MTSSMSLNLQSILLPNKCVISSLITSYKSYVDSSSSFWINQQIFRSERVIVVDRNRLKSIEASGGKWMNESTFNGWENQSSQ